MHRFRSIAIGVLGPGVLVLSAGVAQAKALRGTVVHRNARAHSFVIADASGRLSAIHSARAVRVGRVVVVSVRRLRNGTFASPGIRIVGSRKWTRARGVVTYVDRSRGTFTLSSRGVSMLVLRGGRGGARTADALPSVGTTVSVTGQLDDQGDLQAQSVTGDGTQTSGIDLEGSVLSIDTTARTLSISADDSSQSRHAITVTVPASIDLATFTVGQEVELQAILQSDGSYLLQGSSSDEGFQGANNQGDLQGTESGDQSGGGSDSTPSGSSGGSDTSSAPTAPGVDG